MKQAGKREFLPESVPQSQNIFPEIDTNPTPLPIQSIVKEPQNRKILSHFLHCSHQTISLHTTKMK
jgi:hypothetical protein